MMRALWTSATGMGAQQTYIDVVANNLANVSTTSFKKSQVEFQDLLYETERIAGANNGNKLSPVGIQIGLGVRTASISKIFTQGDLKNTGNSLDIAIEGDGFFQVLVGDTLMYTRAGSFKIDDEGVIVTPDGYPLQPECVIPAETKNIVISANGELKALDVNGEEIANVQIPLYTFVNPAGLDARGRNLYSQTYASGEATENEPGEENTGTLAQGFLEVSNVSVVDEMVNMITGQRAYEMNSKAIQTADSMLQTVVNLKRT